MEEKDYLDLLAEISDTDLKEVNSEKLLVWFDHLSSILHSDALVEELTEEELEKWRKQFDRVNEELSSRGVFKLSLETLVNEHPEVAESLFCALSFQDLVEMERSLATISDCDYKTNLLKILANCKIMRICFLSLNFRKNDSYLS